MFTNINSYTNNSIDGLNMFFLTLALTLNSNKSSSSLTYTSGVIVLHSNLSTIETLDPETEKIQSSSLSPTVEIERLTVCFNHTKIARNSYIDIVRFTGLLWPLWGLETGVDRFVRDAITPQRIKHIYIKCKQELTECFC